jgi:DNA polymerase-3 subunit chi
MTDVRFYHLQKSPLEVALPQLLERVLAGGFRAVVLAGSDARVEALNSLLWTYREESFLPHGSESDGNAAAQPIWLTAEDENPNRADVLVLTDGAESNQISAYVRCCEMFDGRDDEAVAFARARWTTYKAAGHELTYWQQTPQGGWEKKE